MNLFNKAYELAVWAHKDQKRRDGKPYISHIDAVIENTKQLMDDRFTAYLVRPAEKELVLSLSAVHDLIEDHPDKITYELLRKELAPLTMSYNFNYFITGLEAITKKKKGQEEYIDYVLRVKKHNWAKIVKLADLIHNMSDLEPGNLRDKYSLTKYFLEN